VWLRYDRLSSAVRGPRIPADMHRGQSTPPRGRQDVVVDVREHRTSSRLVRSQSADVTRRLSGTAATTPGSTRGFHGAYRRHRCLNLDEEQRRRPTTTHSQPASDTTANSTHRRQQFRCASQSIPSVGLTRHVLDINVYLALPRPSSLLKIE